MFDVMYHILYSYYPLCPLYSQQQQLMCINHMKS